jgi:hypothetical protein
VPTGTRIDVAAPRAGAVAGIAASQPWRTSPGATCHLDRRTHSNPADRSQDAEKRRPLTAFLDSFGVFLCRRRPRLGLRRHSASVAPTLEPPREKFAENEGTRSIDSPFAGPSEELSAPRWTLVTISQLSACPAMTPARDHAIRLWPNLRHTHGSTSKTWPVPPANAASQRGEYHRILFRSSRWFH